MKKISILCTAAMSLSLLSACSNVIIPDSVDIPERVDIVLTKSQSDVLEAGMGFNFDLLRNVFTDGNSVFVSPLSLQAALCMALNGAEGMTYDEIAKAIGYEGKNIGEVNSLFDTLIKGLATVDTSSRFEIANSMWVKKGFEVYPEYRLMLSENYGARCEELDFAASDALQKINGWCSDNTHGMVPKIMDKINDKLQLILLNALYFKGTWANQFMVSNTDKRPFTTISGNEIKADMMHQTNSFRYSQNDFAQFAALPFGNGAYELDVILPNRGSDFNKYVAKFDSAEWESLESRAYFKDVVLSIPKFGMDNTIKLEDALSALGIVEAFTNNAHFPKISGTPLKIAEVTQRAVFKMDENGAEAAAVTEIGFEKCTSAGPSEQVIFNADHPFIFAIRETTSSAILFIGTYTGK